MSPQNKKPLTLQDFIDSQKTRYATNKGIQAVNDYMKIVQPYIDNIIFLEKENKELLEKIPKKQRVKVIKKKK